MKAKFEIKYIEVQWYDKETITKVTESLNCLSPEFNIMNNCFECETTIYPDTTGLRGQLAVRFLDENLKNPYIALPSGEMQDLSPIEDIDTGKTWWIVKNSWDQLNKYWRHTGVNTAGTLKLVLYDQVCHIFIGSIDFTREQLNNYLSSFKDDLWEIILDDSSAIQTDKPSGYIDINEKILNCIYQLILHAGNVLNSPKVELREIQTLKPRKSVKPVNRTFMELVSKANQKFLTSRATTPSYNTAENRYILFALERSYRIIDQIDKLSLRQAKRHADSASRIKNQYQSFSDEIAVNRDLVVRDLEILKERKDIKYWQDRLSKSLKDNGINLVEQKFNVYELCIHIQSYSRNNKTDKKDGFIIKVLSEDQGVLVDNKLTKLSFDIQPHFVDLSEGKQFDYIGLVNCLDIDSEYKLIGNFTYRIFDKLIIYNFSSLVSIEVLHSKKQQDAQRDFTKEREIGIQLNESGWVRKINQAEKEEQEKEKKALLNRYRFYNNNRKVSKYIYQKVAPKKRQLIKIIKSLRRLHIKPSSGFPNSMTFVQNAHYQGVHNGYKNLRQITNLADDDLLTSLEQIDAMGLVNMPLIYERWCLLQIIKILKHSFRYKPQSNWKYQLIDAVKTNKTDIEIFFSNEDAKRFVTLTYEKTLTSGKRPDFIIDLCWYAESDLENKIENKKRFVLDAKFYDLDTFKKFGGLMGVVDQLYNKKNYSESKINPVFIIHPCKTAMIDSARVTSQSWGEYSFLGELAVGNDKSINHQYGGIFLSPIDVMLYADELQRLLGLFLQYKLESSDVKNKDNDSKMRNDRTRSKPFCICCGSVNLRVINKSSGFFNRDGNWVNRTQRSVWMQCNDCEQFISYNHCKNDDTRLIKNGFYWTYHSTRAIQPYNIMCPSCGEWGAW